jgi:uncharacterized protein (TIGR02996 family)
MKPDDAFLADIVAHPDDDAPRLIYADWLDDHGKADRAEFIRLQCRIVRAPADHPDLEAWRQREAQLLRRHGSLWSRPLPYRPYFNSPFHRGFVESVDVDLDQFLQLGDRPWQKPLRMLRFMHVSAPSLRRLVQVPQLARLAALVVTGTWRAAGLAVLLGSPHLRNLRGLSVWNTPLGLAGLETLIDSPLAPNLTHLDLSATRLGLEAMHHLARAASLHSLVALDLHNNRVDVASLRELDGSSHLGSLRRLDLWYNRLGDQGVEEFVRMPLFARLERLVLGYNRLTERGVRALARAPALVNLRLLILGVDRLGHDGVLELAGSPHLHPSAVLVFRNFLHMSIGTRNELSKILGARVQFEPPGFRRNDVVSWPLWRPQT